MKTEMKNFLTAIAPLAKSQADIGEMIIISYLESLWGCDTCSNEVHVNDLLKGINHYSTASINRKLKQLKKNKVLSFEVSSEDERVKIIKKGIHYDDYLKDIEESLPFNNHAFH